MFRENQYWIIITKSKDTFERAMENSDIPIDSNVLLCVRQGFLLEICLSSFRYKEKKPNMIISINYRINSLQSDQHRNMKIYDVYRPLSSKPMR